jgi:hypothetical protein
MGMGRAQEYSMGLAWQGDVIGIASLAGQQPGRFNLGYGL